MLQALKNEGNQEQQFTLLLQHGLYSEQKQASRLPFIGSLEACALLLRKADTKSGGFYSLGSISLSFATSNNKFATEAL